MNDLVKIEKMNFGGEMQDTVSARDLHIFLEVKTEFRHWIKRRLDDALLVEGQDYFISVKNNRNEKVGRKAVDYRLTLDAAKHIALMEKNKQGKKIRQYLMDYERDTRRMLESMVEKDKFMIIFMLF